MAPPPILPTFIDQNVSTEDDAKNCYLTNRTKDRRKSLSTVFKTYCGNSRPFDDINVSRHYENFLIQSVSKSSVSIWISSFLLYLYGIFILFTEYDEKLWFMRIVLICRLVIVSLALYDYVKIFCYNVSAEDEREKFHGFVKSVVSLSNFVIVTVSLVNGAAYVWKSGRGSCLLQDSEPHQQHEVDNEDSYFYNCNPCYEIGGTPSNSMLLLVVGNIFIVSTLRCHSAWAARVNYWVMCISCIAAAAVSRDAGQSLLIILSAFLSIIIYDDIESRSLGMFKALLDLETTKRVQMLEMKQFIGNVAHDLKTPLHGFSMCMDHLLIDSRENIPSGGARDEIIHTVELCRANCNFMSCAINRTLDFSKSATNVALKAKMEPTSIVTSLKWTATCMASTQSRIPIEILPLPINIAKYIVTDKQWFMENILCYLSNAVKYSTRGKVTVSLALEDVVVDESDGVPVSGVPSGMKEASHFVSDWVSASANSADILPLSEETKETKNQSQILCVSVEDEGIGIESHMVSGLFKPFQQTMRMAGGTGLGLFSLAKRVEVLGGKFGVSGRKDGLPGSRFWFSIPYLPDEGYSENFSSETIARESLSNMRNTIGSGYVCVDESTSHSDRISYRMKNVQYEKDELMRINEAGYEECVKPQVLVALVVEDSLVITKATVRMLTTAGYEVDVAENGAVGLDKMKKRAYSIVVMDLQMPIMDGLESVRRLRTWEEQDSFIQTGRRKQLIVGVSANGVDTVMKEALESGMDFFMPKPFSVDKLMEFEVACVDALDP